jgi:hypothetical protein
LEPDTLLKIDRFAGMAGTIDPQDLDSTYSEIQINVGSPRTGELTTRPGLQDLVFDD